MSLFLASNRPVIVTISEQAAELLDMIPKSEVVKSLWIDVGNETGQFEIEIRTPTQRIVFAAKRVDNERGRDGFPALLLDRRGEAQG